MNAAIVCDGKELETYDVKQEGTSSLTAFIASEAGKQFKIKFSNNLTNFEFAILLHIDGRRVQTMHYRPGESGEFLGPYNSACSILPYKFHELQLVGPLSLFTHKDLHQGRVSERSKKAGWHHVATGDEIPVEPRPNSVILDYLDPWTGPPYASIKVFYRPRELLRAQGIIPADDLGRQEYPVNNETRAREGGSPGPSRSHPNMKREELSRDAARRANASSPGQLGGSTIPPSHA
ncbi:hypothetical protein H4582DRAFT_2073628 [Lactarius indigo]|nr:hypothetical protein H4582DRAFT_2073628 [Lactarius indigo]